MLWLARRFQVRSWLYKNKVSLFNEYHLSSWLASHQSEMPWLPIIFLNHFKSEPNILDQIFWIKFIQLNRQNKIPNQSTKIKLEKPNLQNIKRESYSSSSWSWHSSVPKLQTVEVLYPLFEFWTMATVSWQLFGHVELWSQNYKPWHLYGQFSEFIKNGHRTVKGGNPNMRPSMQGGRTI